MERRSWFSKVFEGIKTLTQGKRYELIDSSNTTFNSWDGNMLNSDFVRASIRPKVNAIGKLTPKHIAGSGEYLKHSPDAYLADLLIYPNEHMTMQDLLMRLVWDKELKHNAFAYVKKDYRGYPISIHHIAYSSVEMIECQAELFLKFTFKTGKSQCIPYSDIVHLRKDFCDNDFFGSSGQKAINDVMDIISTTDQGMVSAIKRSAVIRWILKFKQIMRPEDQEKEKKQFSEGSLNPATSLGVVASDPKYDVEQIKETSFLPNAAQMKEPYQRLFSYFGVNESIIQNKWDENQFNAFYESEVEPYAIQLTNEFTRAIFTRRERGYGNRIVFEANNIQCASMQTKLNLFQMVDRGSLCPNEWREAMNLGPIEDGDKPIRRLDTAQVGGESKK